MTTNQQFLPAIDKLTGRDNYVTWQFAVRAYLEHEGLWDCVTGSATDAKNLVKAKSKLILLIHPTNYVHIKKCTSAKEIWDTLQAFFSDSGLTRRVCLIRTLTTTKLIDCANVEEYVQVIMNAAHKLQAINCDVADEWIGTFMLAGLPEYYHPMIMAIENSGMSITGDAIKTKLLQDVKSETSIIEVSAASDQIKQLSVTDSITSGKDKTPMCLVNELARFNKIQHQYRLTGEQGPAHKKRFTVTLKLGDEEYSSDGTSIKKAQHLAAADAITKTQYKHPPAKSNRKN
ncbi:Maternal effect protein staufen [Pseudolycoriella hygida]|uniref:Maternal effect protein staufen n=1 Tax=Pseudolycoriella hygida TaxID=35572 RepID=A0A9Q0S300_9DIPT|nr:Maternal effect protein staufen [Pseudolycoriella hygida]